MARTSGADCWSSPADRLWRVCGPADLPWRRRFASTLTTSTTGLLFWTF